MRIHNLSHWVCLTFSILLLGCASTQGTHQPVATQLIEFQTSIIPKPVKQVSLPGFFMIDRNTPIVMDGDLNSIYPNAKFLSDLFVSASGYRLPIFTVPSPHSNKKAILLTTRCVSNDIGSEGYELKVTPERIVLTAHTNSGLFYGIQTLRQLLPAKIEGKNHIPVIHQWEIPALSIKDRPRFVWRGLMLDSSRHFQDKAFILELLDTMALYKLNRFHWHLIDAHAWRLEIDRYPLLTEIAAWRGTGENRYGGYYTKADVREILAHAKKRHIQVIPEIEMPAHIAAALYAYPELTCKGERFQIGDGGLTQYTDHVGNLPLCAGKDEVFVFLENVLDEIVEIFDSPIIHVGGDERPAGVWESCPYCQARIKAEGLRNEHQLQNWFMCKISDYLATKNRRVMSWAVTESNPYNPTDMDDLGNNAIIQNWHDGTVFAARQGWDVVNSINGYVYLDYPEFPGMNKPSWMPLLNLEKVYQFDPVPSNLEPERHHQILGGEACLWTELVPQEKVYPTLFPRLLAVAESVWTPAEEKSFPDFKRRVDKQKSRLALRGVIYGQPPQD